ncbi:hypothetical protein [Orbus mooreae]|uniref:hypothetical protein n=1 Tax=Orbus mooreae TaxID=3074107 RepID=UPI00370D66FC
MLEQYNKVDALSSAKNFMSGTSSTYLSDDQKKALQSKLDEIEIAKKADEQAKEAEKKRLEALKASEELKRESERQREQAQAKYKELTLSLRTAEQKSLDDMREKYDLVSKVVESEKERYAIMQKISEQSITAAPGSALSSYTGIGSDMINIATQDKALDDWRKTELQKQAEFLNQKFILKSDHEKNVAKIEEQFRKTKEENESAMQMATLGVFSSMTGNIADMFKETAGESSLAYKTMFLASKAASIAQAIISTEVAANKALELGPILGISASSMVRGLGYASVGLIASQTLAGMAHDGIDNIPREGTWLLDKGERVVDARTNADLKDFIKSKQSSGNLTITIPVNIADGSVSEQDGQNLGRMIKQSVISVIEEQQRPGGVLNKR